MPALKNEDQEPQESDRPGVRALAHLNVAKTEYIVLAANAGRSPEGRAYDILVTKIEELAFVALGYFPEDGEA